MRKNASARPWTTSEERYLVENAGRIPKRDICKHLKRSAASVRHKAAELRDQGVAIDLRCYQADAATCPACGALRATIDQTGFCEPCRRQNQLTDIESRIANLLPYLPPEERSIYSDTEAERESRIDAKPQAPDVSRLSHYQADRLMALWELDTEQWLISNLKRRVKAAQKRKERIQEKLKNEWDFPR